MKHILALIIGLFALAVAICVSWVLSIHPEIIALAVAVIIVLLFAYVIGWKILNEFSNK